MCQIKIKISYSQLGQKVEYNHFLSKFFINNIIVDDSD